MKGLLVVATVAPLGHFIALASGAPRAHLSDAIAVAFIAGWLLRRLPDRWGPRVAAPLAAWSLGALVVASAAGVMWQQGVGSDARVAAARVLEGLALVAATVALFRQHPGLATTLPLAIAASTSVAALYAVTRAPAIDADAFIASFALVSCLAIGMAIRASGRARVTWAAVGVWLIVASGLVIVRAPNTASAFTRTEPLMAATLRMLASRPLFGIGIGQDATTSPLFFSPWLAWHGGAGGTHNLLVIAAELGILGLAIWVIWIGAGLLRAARALAIDRRDARLWGATAGVVAFIAALAISRPLASSETVFPFFLQFGLITALAGSTLLNAAPANTEDAVMARHSTRRPWLRFAVTALGVSAIAAGALVSARRGPIEHPQSQDVDGFYGWETSSSGERFRWAEEYASLFVPADVTTVRVPMRAPSAPGRSPIAVEIKIDGGDARRTIVDDAWRTVDIALAKQASGARLRRIDLRTPGVRVQIGEIQFVRER